MISSDRIHVDLHTRGDDGHWVLTEAGRLEETLELRSIGCTLSLATLYDKVEF